MSVNVTEVVKKLIGPILPVGETHTDDTRMANLRETVRLIKYLVQRVEEVESLRGQPEYSVHRAGTYARDSLDALKSRLERDDV